MEAQEPLFRRGVPTLQTSLTSRELPPCPRLFRSENLFRFWRVAGSWGKFLCLGRYEFVAACGCRACFVGRRRSDITPYASAGHYIVGNDPCVVPYRGMLLTDLFLCERRLIPPHQSPAATNCLQFSSPRGEAFLTLCEQGKYHFMLWFAFAIRPHLSPAAANCSQFSSPLQRGRLWCATLSSGLAF